MPAPQDVATVDPEGAASVRPRLLLRLSRYAILSGLAELVPLPIVDESIAKRVRRRQVRALLRSHHRTVNVDHLQPLYGSGASSLGGKAAAWGRRLVLRPFRRALRKILIFTLVRAAVLEATRTLIAGVSLNRVLREGWFADDATAEEHEDQARRLRVAVDAAVKSPERRGVTAAIRASGRLLREGGGLRQRINRAASDLRDRLSGFSLRPVTDRVDRLLSRQSP